MNIEKYKHKDWVKIYEGRWSFLTSTHFIDQYTKEIRFGKRPFMPEAIILIAKNRSSGWVRQQDRDVLGKYLSGQIIKNPKHVKKIAENLKSQAISFLKFIDEYENAEVTLELYEEFWDRLLAYYHPHINVKYVVDYLPENLLKKYLPILQNARLVAEPVLNRTEDFISNFAKSISIKTTYSQDLILCLSKQELQKYFSNKKLPKKIDLEKRYKQSALLGDEKSFGVVVGKVARNVQKMIEGDKNQSITKGSIAFPGKVIGRALVIEDPRKEKGFKKGDILVAGSTRPEFLALMYKAAAFVTDAGGILSHAAITAREMKKPCVIGTKIATKIFKDGDMIEVDAHKGIVRKI